MVKHAITIGNFDCLNIKHVHLIKQMRKMVMPGKSIGCYIFQDYPIFLREQRFPVQNYEHRKNNLEFLCDNISPIMQKDGIVRIKDLAERCKKEGARLSVVCYEEDKDMLEIKFCRENKIAVKIIKPPKI